MLRTATSLLGSDIGCATTAGNNCNSCLRTTAHLTCFRACFCTLPAVIYGNNPLPNWRKQAWKMCALVTTTS